MTTRHLLLAAIASAGLVASAIAAGPELSIGASCQSNEALAGAALIVPVTFRANVDDAGQRNRVAAADFFVTFAADVLVVKDVRLPAALAATDQWTLDWEGSLDLPLTPGRVRIALSPGFVFPVPTIPDGTIVELELALAAGAPAGCVPIVIPTEGDAVQFSLEPLGLSVAAGPITNGGVTVGTTTTTTTTTTQPPRHEQCSDCADNDADGLVDLADPDCGAAVMSFGAKPEKLVVKRKKSGSPAVVLRGSLPKAVAAAAPLRVVLRADDEGAACLAVEAQSDKGKGKKKRTYVFKRGGKKVATLVSDSTRNRSRLVATISGLAVPENAGAIGVSIWSGTDPFHALLRLQQCTTKKVCTYR